MAKEVDGVLYPDDRVPNRLLDVKPDFRRFTPGVLPTFDPAAENSLWKNGDSIAVSDGSATFNPVSGSDWLHVTLDMLPTFDPDIEGLLWSLDGVAQISSGDSLAQYKLYDDFTGEVTALNGRLPKKGPAWTVVGSGAAFMVAGDGEMNMDGGAGLVGYATAVFDEPAGKLTAIWSTTEVAPALYPSTLAFLTGFNTAIDTLVHAEQSFIRLLSPADPAFVMPQWSLISSATYGPGVQYRTEFFVEGKHARVLTYNNTTGAIVSYNYVYDIDMQARMGPLAFYEIIDNKLRYNLVTAEDVPVGGFGGWPTLDILKETNFASGADGMVASPFGGTVTAGTNKVTITSNGYGQGGCMPLGPTGIVAGDRVRFSFDVSNLSYLGLDPEVALMLTAGSAEQSTVVQFNNNGRVQGELTATGSGVMSLIITVPNGGNQFTMDVSKMLIVKNPPASMGDDPAMFADGPAPSGFHWEFVTVDGVRQTQNGVYVVALAAD